MKYLLRSTKVTFHFRSFKENCKEGLNSISKQETVLFENQQKSKSLLQGYQNTNKEGIKDNKKKTLIDCFKITEWLPVD